MANGGGILQALLQALPALGAVAGGATRGIQAGQALTAEQLRQRQIQEQLELARQNAELAQQQEARRAAAEGRAAELFPFQLQTAQQGISPVAGIPLLAQVAGERPGLGVDALAPETTLQQLTQIAGLFPTEQEIAAREALTGLRGAQRTKALRTPTPKPTKPDRSEILSFEKAVSEARLLGNQLGPLRQTIAQKERQLSLITGGGKRQLKGQEAQFASGLKREIETLREQEQFILQRLAVIRDRQPTAFNDPEVQGAIGTGVAGGGLSSRARTVAPTQNGT